MNIQLHSYLVCTIIAYTQSTMYPSSCSIFVCILKLRRRMLYAPEGRNRIEFLSFSCIFYFFFFSFFIFPTYETPTFAHISRKAYRCEIIGCLLMFFRSSFTLFFFVSYNGFKEKLAFGWAARALEQRPTVCRHRLRTFVNFCTDKIWLLLYTWTIGALIVPLLCHFFGKRREHEIKTWSWTTKYILTN